jgi:hypothetical protein
MTNKLLLVDFENVNKIDLAAIPEGVHVPFFFGASQKSVPTEFMRAALKLGARFEPIDIEGQGKNALDFHIAFYLGEHLAKAPKTDCAVLSKDKGFDPLIKHLCGRGFAVRRAETLAQIFSTSKRSTVAKARQAALSPFDQISAWLSVTPPRNRPKKRKKLCAHIHSHFKEISEPDVDKMIDRLIAEKKITDDEGAITYRF